MEQKVGKRVDDPSPRDLPAKSGFKGRLVELHPIESSKQVQDLYAISSGSAERDAIWTYIPLSGPFDTEAQMEAWIKRCRDHPAFIFYAVFDCAKQRYVGMTSFVSIEPAMQRLEVGFIWYALDSQRTKTNTESIYLMLCEAFDRLRYRRVEWKCDALNQPSRTAALRLGFRFEGIFLNHMIVNGCNRDTSWFAMTDAHWPTIKPIMEQWLYDGGPYFSLGDAIYQAYSAHSEIQA